MWRKLSSAEKEIYEKIGSKMKDSPYEDLGTKAPADINEYKKRLGLSWLPLFLIVIVILKEKV